MFHAAASLLQKSASSKAVPLLLIHGWPGSVAEFFDFIPRLTQPAEVRVMGLETAAGAPNVLFVFVLHTFPFWLEPMSY